jgi:DNA repair protein RecO (recombination protein O)
MESYLFPIATPRKALTNPQSPRVYRTEGIVLKGYDYGEADRILTLYTPQLGKVRAIAKGVRRIKSRKAGHLDLFTRANLLVARGRQLDIVTQAETIEPFAGMRTDLVRLSYAHYVAELVDAFTVEGMANYPAYATTISTLRRIATANEPTLSVRSFELQLLALMGYRPQLHRCLNCDSTIQPVSNRFSPKMGGVLCPNCASEDGAARPISVEALKVLRNLQTNESGILQLSGVPIEVGQEVEARLQEYITYRLEKGPRSVRFLDQLRTEGVRP